MWTSIHIYLPDGSSSEDLHAAVTSILPVLKVGGEDSRHTLPLARGPSSISINHESDDVRESRSYEAKLSRRGRIEPC